jgi:hypothetical protein
MSRINSTTIIMLAIIATTSANAATVNGTGVMACPSIEAWEQVMEGLHNRVSDAINAANNAGCVSVPKGTTVKVMGTVGPLSRVRAPNGRDFYFRSDDLL